MHDVLHLELVLITCQFLSQPIDLGGEPHSFTKFTYFGNTYSYNNDIFILRMDQVIMQFIMVLDLDDFCKHFVLKRNCFVSLS